MHDANVKRFIGVFLILVLVAGIYAKRGWLLSAADLAIHGPKTVSERVAQYKKTVDARLIPDFAKAGVAYPPTKITLVILKQERRVELYAQGATDLSAYHFIQSYPILAASGHLGPKLREGDWQVPEGIYAIESLNPNSHYHLALHVDYPNAFDRAQAKLDNRTNLGGDIMIHGSNVSIGCVALGDSAAEDLFVLSAEVGLPHVRLLFCPFDFRVTKQASETDQLPPWTAKLYADLEQNLSTLPRPPQPL